MLRKLIVATLLLVLAFSATATNILFVQAEAGGTGKFLTVGIVGGGYVNATKEKSGEYWEFFESDTRKVGAGTILLEAVADQGWRFSCWTGDLTDAPNPTEYKTQKYGEVTAIFVKQTHTITATADGPGTINGEPWLIVEVEDGGVSPPFFFATDNDHHITYIKVDNDYISYRPSYAFPDPITSDHTIIVGFDEVGTARVPDGDNVRMFIDPIASILYDETGGGTVSGTALFIPEGTSVFFYEIDTTAGDGGGAELIGIQLSGDIPDHVDVYLGDNPDVLYSDVDGSGEVDITDHTLVANAISSASEPHPYIEEFDVNRDGSLNNYDVLTVNQNMGATLTPLESWIDDDILYFYCGEWSPNCFRGR